MQRKTRLKTEIRTGSGTTIREGGLGHDPFAITEEETLTVEMRQRMDAFYDQIDRDLIREAYRRDRVAFKKALDRCTVGGRK